MEQLPPTADGILPRHSSYYDRCADPIHVLHRELGRRAPGIDDGAAASDDDIFLDFDLQALLSSPSPSGSAPGPDDRSVSGGGSDFHDDDDDSGGGGGGGYFEFDGGVPAGHAAVLSRRLQLDGRSVDHYVHLPSLYNHPNGVPHPVAECRNVRTTTTTTDMAVGGGRRCSGDFGSSSGCGEFEAGGYSPVNLDLGQRSNEATMMMMAASTAAFEKPVPPSTAPVPSTTTITSADHANLSAASNPAANRRLIAAAALANLNLWPAGGAADWQRKRSSSRSAATTSRLRPYGRRSWLSACGGVDQIQTASESKRRCSTTTSPADSRAAAAVLRRNQRRPQWSDNGNPPPYGSSDDADRFITYAATEDRTCFPVANGGTDHHHNNNNNKKMLSQPPPPLAEALPSPEQRRTAASSTTTTTSSSSITSACNGSNYSEKQFKGSAGRSHDVIQRREDDGAAPIALRECSSCCCFKEAPPIITSVCGGGGRRGGGTTEDAPGGGGGGARWAAREAVWTAAALEPVDWTELMAATARSRPKRRNVRISKDPQSVSARRRRERISDRIRVLQKLVPNSAKMDTASMLDEAMHYLQFLQAQVAAAAACR